MKTQKKVPTTKGRELHKRYFHLNKSCLKTELQKAAVSKDRILQVKLTKNKAYIQHFINILRKNLQKTFL